MASLFLGLSALAWISVPVVAAESPVEKGEQSDGDKAESKPKLPKPLEEISANYKDIEQSGYFRIVNIDYGRNREYNEEALIWTLSVVKPIACRHAILLLDRFTDVRFYRTAKEWRKELHATRLYYPAWIGSRAANGESLLQDEQFQIWIPLDKARIQRLRIDRAEFVELGPPKR
jgi:hypothetical protein